MKRLTPLLGIPALLILWQGASLLLSARLVPPPRLVLGLFLELLPGELGLHGLASLGRAVAAILISTAAALPFGILLGRYRRIDRYLSPLVYILYPAPKIAFLPVFMLVLGIGNTAKIALVVAVVVFQMTILVRDAVRSISIEHIRVVAAHGGSERDILRWVVLPASLGGVFSSLRLAGGTALAVLFFAETFFTTYGLGQFIMDAWSRIDYPRMYAGIAALSLVGWFLFSSIDFLERALCPWKAPWRAGREGEKKEAPL